jgi:hypothetical protein
LLLGTSGLFRASEYLTLPNPSVGDWQRVVRNLDATLSSVRVLLGDVQKERSDFVLEPLYLALSRTHTARSSLLGQLATLPAPSAPEEREALCQGNEKYKLLIANAEQAVLELNAYVKARK